MPYPRRLLNEGEQIALDLRPHWLFFGRELAAGVLVFALLIGAFLVPSEWEFASPAARILGAAITVVWAVTLAVRLIKWQTTHIVITSDRLIFRRGVLSKFGREIPLERVNDITFRQSFFERIMGAGDLLIESAGERGQETFNDVPHPDRVQQEIYRQTEGQWERRYGTARPAGGAQSIPKQIAELAELCDRGVITREQFEAKKAELLERM
jgi:membrane protein YdbS with pleckstrin-like domain